MRLRIKKLVKHELQLKMIGVFVGLACICGFFQLLLINRSLMTLLRDASIDDPSVLQRVPSILTTNFLVTLAVLVPLMGYVGLLMTQRIAGPVYRFEKYIDGLVKGDESRPCKIRKGDELQDLCDRINTIGARWLVEVPQDQTDTAVAEPGASQAAESSADAA